MGCRNKVRSGGLLHTAGRRQPRPASPGVGTPGEARFPPCPGRGVRGAVREPQRRSSVADTGSSPYARAPLASFLAHHGTGPSRGGRGQDRDMKSRADERATPEQEPSSPSLPARLTLRPPTFPPGPVSGAWWPRSHDLMTELPILTEAFDALRARVTSIASRRGTWPVAPCDLPTTGHTVKAAWFASGFDLYTIRLYSYGVGRWDLLVVPPGTEAAAAARLMTAAADPALHLTASALVAAEQHRLDADGTRCERERVEQWEGEGGTTGRPSGDLPFFHNCYGP